MSGKIEYIEGRLSGLPGSRNIEEGVDYGIGGRANKFIWLTEKLAAETGVPTTFQSSKGQFCAINIFFPKEDEAGDLPVSVTSKGYYDVESDVIASKVFVFLHDDLLNVRKERPEKNQNFGFPSQWGGRRAFFNRSEAREYVDEILEDYKVVALHDERERAIVESATRKQAEEKAKLIAQLNESEALMKAKKLEEDNAAELIELRRRVEEVNNAAKAKAAKALAEEEAVEQKQKPAYTEQAPVLSEQEVAQVESFAAEFEDEEELAPIKPAPKKPAPKKKAAPKKPAPKKKLDLSKPATN